MRDTMTEDEIVAKLMECERKSWAEDFSRLRSRYDPPAVAAQIITTILSSPRPVRASVVNKGSPQNTAKSAATKRLYCT